MTYAEIETERNGHTLVDEQKEWAKKLKPCPFCGHSLVDDYMFCFEFHKHEINPDEYAVTCTNCGAQSKGSVTIELAVKEWNRRGGRYDE